MREQVKKIVQKAVAHITDHEIDFSVEVPADKKYGDYSANAAFALTKYLRRNPVEIANLIKEGIEEKNNCFQKIEVVNGFLNFYLSNDFFVKNLERILKEKESFGRSSELKNKKYIIDYTDPNPFKELHIGHLMNNAIGESLSRIFEFNGAKIKRVCYQGDVGMHVAKAMWGILQNKDGFPKSTAPLSEKIKFLGSSYVLGAAKYENDESAKREIKELNKKIFERTDKQINKYYDSGRKWSLQHFGELYKKLGTKFDYFILESQVISDAKKIITENLQKGIFERSDGAIVFKGESYGLHTRVFINSEGLPTYEAKDLALAGIKYKKYPYDVSVVITANEQSDYFKVMLCALNIINSSLAQKTKHISHGMLRLASGKMSSRSGNVISGESLIEKIQDLVGQKMKERGLSEKEKMEISEKVAVGALRYSILKQSVGSDIIYDFEKSISFEGDSGPYLQYSYARAKSVFKKAATEKIKFSLKKIPNEITYFEKMMCYFPDVIKEVNKKNEPHHLALYLMELAGEFNNYYSKNKIVDKKDEYSPYKIATTLAFSIIMKNGLALLGIESLEKM